MLILFKKQNNLKEYQIKIKPFNCQIIFLNHTEFSKRNFTYFLIIIYIINIQFIIF